MRRRIVHPIVLVLAAVLAVPATATAAPQAPGGPHDPLGYWTPDRVRGARPAEVVLDVPPEGHRGPGVVEEFDLGGPAVQTGAPWPDGSPEPVDDLVGKVLFTLGTTDYVCSASTIAPAAGTTWVLLTAGHCTWDDAVGSARNWVFVPDYEDVLQFGCLGPGRETNEAARCYAAASLHPAAGWTRPGDDYDHDVAFARMSSALPTDLYGGVTLPVLGVDAAIGVDAYAFGYPAAKKYSGSDLVYCRGTTTAGPGSFSSVAQLGCDMTGGSSGGPWYVDEPTGLVAVSLNSFGLRTYQGSMFGPVFDEQAIEALITASGPGPLITAGARALNPEGDVGSQFVEVPVSLSGPASVPITVDWATLDVPSNPAVAHPGEDYRGASGTLRFAPGETQASIAIEVFGDLVDEPPLWLGEWGLVQLSGPSYGAIDLGGLFGLGIFVIIDDDP